MKKRVFALILALACVLQLAACASNTETKASETSVASTESKSAASESASETEAETEETSKYGGILHVGQETLDYSVAIGAPYEVTGKEQSTAFEAIYERLWVRGTDGSVELQLADSYEVSEDGLTYTFVLKKGIKFHDGSDLNAEVVAWCLSKTAENGMITGLQSVEAIDEYTVAFHLSQANPFFLSANTAKECLCICSKANYDKLGEDAARTNPVGTGPFKFVSMEVGQSIVLTRNENYWQTDEDGNQLPYLDGVEITAIGDPTVAAAALSNGELDLYTGTLTDLTANLETYGIDNFKIEKGSFPGKAAGIRFMANSRNAKLFTDERLRKAVAYAIDGEAVVTTFSEHNVDYCEQIALPGTKDYIENATSYEYNPEKAKELLAEAGYPNGFEIDINIDTTAASKTLAELYQYYLGEVGIKVNIASYANAERNAIQDSDDAGDQLLISSTTIQGDTSYIWSNCSPLRKKWCNMLPFETEPEWVELWNKVSESKTQDEAYENLKEYFAYSYEHCCQYLFMTEYSDFKYMRANVELQSEKSGQKFTSLRYAYFD